MSGFKRREFCVVFIPYISEEYPDYQGDELERYACEVDARDRMFDLVSSGTIEIATLLEVNYVGTGWGTREISCWDACQEDLAS